MSHGVMAKQMVPVCAYLFLSRKSEDAKKIACPWSFAENEYEDFDYDAKKPHVKFPVVAGGWSWAGDASYPKKDNKDYSNLIGDLWVKDGKKIFVSNCSQYCHVGDYEMWAIPVDGDVNVVKEFLVDMEKASVITEQSEVCENEILLNWG